MSRILVTGANGFIGQSLCAEALRQGWQVKGTTRSACTMPAGAEIAVVGSMDDETDWTKALCGVDVVIHLAARVHVMVDAAPDPLAEFLLINLHGSKRLAYQAAHAGVKRLVYVSSIKVNGEWTTESRPFVESDIPDPQDAYAISKWQAEQALQRIAGETGLQIVIVRPPLVYGPEVKGNFRRLLAAVYRGIPLPLASVQNARSLIYLENLVSALMCCATHPAAAGKTYLVCDGDDTSIAQLVRQLAKGLDSIPRLFPMPLKLLRGLGALFGRLAAVDRLLESLRIDDGLIRKELAWKPSYTLSQGLQITSDWYKKQRCAPDIPGLEKRPGVCHADGGVTVIMVNYNAGSMLLESVARARRQAEQVVVVDNASTDDSIAVLRRTFPDVQIICNERNLGFATACNLGAQAAVGGHLLFLNPDCILEPGAVAILVAVAHSEKDIGMVGGLLTNPDGTEQSGGRRAVPTPWRSFVRVSGFGALSGRYPKLFDDFALHKRPLPVQPIEVEAISGACMLVRRDALEQIGLLDQGYFMHCEDLDWCMRFRRKGWRILFAPDARMIHYKGHSSQSRPIFVEWNKHKGMMRFYNKFFRHQYPGLLMGLVLVAVWIRFAVITIYHLRGRVLQKLGLRRV